MKLGVYSIRDIKSGYNYLGTDINDDLAMRAFCNAVSNDKSMMSKFKSDFDFVKLGEFDTDTGVITPLDKVILMNGSDVDEI